MIKKVKIYPATTNEAIVNPFFSNIEAPVLKLIELKEKKQPPIFLFCLSNAYVSPYGPVFKNGIVYRESVYKCSTKKRTAVFLSFCKKILRNKVRMIEGDCVVINHSWYHSYGHWLTEIIPRLFLIKDELSGKRLVIHKDLLGFHLEMLTKFNFKDIVFIEDDELIRCETVYFTSFPNYYINQTLSLDSQYIKTTELNINYSVMREMTQWFKSKNPLITNQFGYDIGKVYISRGKARHMKIINELEFEKILIQRGFVKIFLEDISFDEQVQVLNNASIVISSHGSGLANALFMRPGTHIINLASYHHHDYFCLPLAAAANMNYTHINCEGTGKLGPAYNNITVDIKVIQGVLDSIDK
ncbi:MAG: hypothetical protein K0R26_2680 [Bacteroidota bacterium]|nr:hypothetical protein [Bacteroidota bacterium]